MKKLSIKIKIAILFTLPVTAVVTVALFALLSVGRHMAVSATKNDLIEIVTESRTDIEYEYGVLDFDDSLKYYENGVSLSVYNGAGQLLYGRQPGGLTPAELPLSHAEMRVVGESPRSHYVYDMEYRQEGYGALWVRGVLPTDGADAAFAALLRPAAVILPLLVIIGAVGAYFVAGGALKPVTQIAKTAEEIAAGGDLSKRPDIGDGGDEIHSLAATFDRMLERLRDAFEKERQFTADASHELRTPVSVIISQCEYTLSNADSGEEHRTALETVLGQARWMSALISQLLSFARADKGGADIRMETVDLSGLARGVAERAAEIAKDGGITVHADIEDGLTVTGDETLLISMMWNLLENGIKYGKPGGTARFTLRGEKDAVVGEVRDDGIGIAAEHLEKIWGRFYRVDKSRSGDGFGLGLPMVKYVAEAHGGGVSAKSEPGVGSVFTFKLPGKK
ncbi:MAG: HAMP domain-containing histidine kinase [Clostridiales Family XIII bacterium]|jgi:signal transduction histidine kinase|nr:HAMP domain-containing histidine kinase [Clostridiales Family XIII bacterium]